MTTPKSDLAWLLEALVNDPTGYVLSKTVRHAIALRDKARAEDAAKAAQNTHATGSEGASLASSPQSDLSGQAASLGPKPKGGGDVRRYVASELAANYPNRKDSTIISGPYVTAVDYDALLAERDALRADAAYYREQATGLGKANELLQADYDAARAELKEAVGLLREVHKDVPFKIRNSVVEAIDAFLDRVGKQP